MKIINFLWEIISTIVLVLITVTLEIVYPQLGGKMLIKLVWVIFIAWMLVFSIIKARKVIISKKREEMAEIKDTFISKINTVHEELAQFEEKFEKLNKTLKDLDSQIQNTGTSINNNISQVSQMVKDANIASK